ncbi:hypothetical protein GP486_006010 [Trichoglossum hirsutum]|uniref:Uncharacterized protein n=1 Tax=Trichoglossum hirsutum TaxID=265104 RepID=A0A9P8RL80_9PEZI|nr:hypothetical protein GP486_006010 [Trichoglossum hirsutum]
MWKRLPIHNRPRDPVISHPVLIDTSLDRETLDELPNISDLQNRRDARLDSPPSQRIEDTEKGLPPLPIQPGQTQRPISDAPTASSIYSQAPIDPHQYHRSLSKSPRPPSTYSDVSPPDSPEMNADRGLQERYRRSPSISPIDEKFEIPDIPKTRSSKYTSSIPILRREKRRAQGHIVAKGRNLSDERVVSAPRLTRWDDFSGEPIIDDSGKASTAWSESYLRDPTSSDGGHPKYKTRTIGARVSNQEAQDGTNRDSGRSAFGLSLGTRGDWKGAVSRFSRSSPTDKMLPPSETIPRNTDGPNLNAEDSRTRHRSNVGTTLNTGRASPGLRLPLDDDDSMKPIVPLKAGRNSPPRILTSPTSLKAPTSLSSPVSGDPKSAVLSSANRDSRNKPLPTPISGDPDAEASGIELNFRNAMRSIQEAEPIASKSGAATFATGATYDTPPTTPKADSPSSSNANPPSPILSRRRPVPSSNEKAITRKPPPSQDRNNSPTPTQTPTTHHLRNSKSLPQSPPEAESVDLITTLEAQLGNLHTRRANLQKILRELSLLLPPNPSTHNVSARGEMKKRVEDHKMELAEILKEEHEVGLRLHRAWRRRDKFGPLEEPTGLWIRRVTS